MTFNEYNTLLTSVDEHASKVATIEINRPDARNALNAEVRRELKDALEVAESTDAIRVVVLTGSDEAKAFVAGADVTEFRDRDLIEQREVSKRPRVYERIDNLSVPVIGRINGFALGGGCELALACDVRIGSTEAKLGQPEINLGLIPGGGATQRLPRLVGEGNAMKLILSGEIIDATEACDMGLLDEVCEEEALNERVYSLAGKMAEKSPIALELAKDAIRASSRMDLEAGIEYEAELFVQMFATEDKNRGIDAFLEDRTPEFTGK